MRSGYLNRFNIVTIVKKRPGIGVEELSKLCGFRYSAQAYKYLRELENDGLVWRLNGQPGVFPGKRPAHIKDYDTNTEWRKAAALLGQERRKERAATLEQRIERIAQRAAEREASVDVIHGNGWEFRPDMTIRGSRVG